MSRTIVKPFDVGAAIPSTLLTAAERPIAALSSVRGWWEADHGYSVSAGGIWRDKLRGIGAFTFNDLDAVSEVVSDLTRLRFGYDASAGFSGTDRGALQAETEFPLLSSAGFTVFSVQRVATVASAESATLGGYVWSSRGVSGATLPGLNISGSTGNPVFRAGGVTLSNPGFDLRDGSLHVVRCTYNAAETSINTRVDRDRASSTRSDAETPPDTDVAGMLTPSIGAMISNAIPPALASPFYGQVYGLIFCNSALDDASAAVIEDYLADKYGFTLV